MIHSIRHSWRLCLVAMSFLGAFSGNRDLASFKLNSTVGSVFAYDYDHDHDHDDDDPPPPVDDDEPENDDDDGDDNDE